MLVKSADQLGLDMPKVKGLLTGVITALSVPVMLEPRNEFQFRYAVSYCSPSDI